MTMPPPLLFDLSTIELERTMFDKDDICQVNPQRYEMQHLDGIIWYDKNKMMLLGYKDVTDGEFWTRGHIPGRPLMPGVIMIEAAAQLLSFFVRKVYEVDAFIGFAGIESAKFRGTVAPGKRLHLLGHLSTFRSRKYTATIQGVVDGTIVFDTTVSGMKV